jgi:hypothetical protein
MHGGLPRPPTDERYPSLLQGTQINFKTSEHLEGLVAFNP